MNNMEKKYRVRQVGNKFYPQVKHFLFWFNLLSFDAKHPRHTSCERVCCHPFKRCFERSYTSTEFRTIEEKEISFFSLNDAKKFIEEYVKCPKYFEYKGHKIVKTYNGIYIDLSTNVYIGEYDWDVYYLNYAGTIEQLELIIDMFEHDWEESKIRKNYNL